MNKRIASNNFENKQIASTIKAKKNSSTSCLSHHNYTSIIFRQKKQTENTFIVIVIIVTVKRLNYNSKLITFDLGIFINNSNSSIKHHSMPL